MRSLLKRSRIDEAELFWAVGTMTIVMGQLLAIFEIQLFYLTVSMVSSPLLSRLFVVVELKYEAIVSRVFLQPR